jgi:hypothetical protein
MSEGEKSDFLHSANLLMPVTVCDPRYATSWRVFFDVVLSAVARMRSNASPQLRSPGAGRRYLGGGDSLPKRPSIFLLKPIAEPDGGSEKPARMASFPGSQETSLVGRMGGAVCRIGGQIPPFQGFDSWRPCTYRNVGQSTVAKFMAKRRQPPSQGWRTTSVRNHADAIASIDMFMVPTISFGLLYGVLTLRQPRREILWLDVTAHPNAEWLARQLTETCGWDEPPRYLIRDRDRAYGVPSSGTSRPPVASAGKARRQYGEHSRTASREMTDLTERRRIISEPSQPDDSRCFDRSRCGKFRFTFNERF